MRHLERKTGKATFLFCSSYALYPPFLRVAELIARSENLAGNVIAQEFPHPTFYHHVGRFAVRDSDIPQSLSFNFLPANRNDVERFGFDANLLSRLLQQLNPKYIWIQGEFWQGIAHQILWYYRFRKYPRIIAYIAANHLRCPTPLISGTWPFISRTRLRQLSLWPRLDGVAACATKSMECARRIGLPETVPITVNYFPVFGPEDAGDEGVTSPWPRNDSFIIGFAGLLTEQKGWKILLEAVERLPERFKVIIAGDGEQRNELQTWLRRPDLQGKAYYTGWLPKERLLATYPLFDVFVLPSITTRYSVEQFGAVLAEAMACGVPVIGSDSGAIPEIVNQAGLTVPEGDSEALAQAILSLSENSEQCQRMAARGRENFRTYFSCESYARSIINMLSME
jgi:glycosyltransferase involved in cell wall biosynthesis